MRKTFVVGRLTGRTAEIRLLEDDDRVPGQGSGSRLLQALARSLSTTAVQAAPLSCPGTVH
jgi:hypothetical protein